MLHYSISNMATSIGYFHQKKSREFVRLCLSFSVLLSICFGVHACDTSEPIVTTQLGVTRGRCHSISVDGIGAKSLNVFLGIPYGQPPIHHLRFRKPQAVSQWLGIHNASSYRESCLRFPEELYKPKDKSSSGIPHGNHHDMSADPHDSHHDMSADPHDSHHNMSADPHGNHQDMSADPHGNHPDMSADPHGNHPDMSADPHGNHPDMSADPHGNHPDMSADPHDSHNGHMDNQTVHDEAESEDCLYLNVFVPANSSSSLPVLIWFPGHERMYDGSVLAAAGDIIVVTVSFRTGLFGFLSIGHPSLSGNYGLFDQRMAMQWVKDNIESFGGDSNNITLAGHGISGAMVGLHLLHEEQQSIFQRAISMSGYVLDPFFVRDTDIMHQYVFSTDHLNCTSIYNISGVVDCLQTKPVSELHEHFAHIRHSYPYSVLFGPTVDGDFLEDDPITLLERGHFTEVDYLQGGNKDDGTRLYNLISKTTLDNLNQQSFITTVRRLSNSIFPNGPQVSTAIIDEYATLGNSSSFGETLRNIATDYMAGNSLFTARHISKKSNVYYYRFNNVDEHTPNRQIVEYGSIVPYLLGFNDAANHHMETHNHSHVHPHMNNTNTHVNPDDEHHAEGSHHNSTEEETLSRLIMNTWASFVMNGKPRLQGGVQWDAFDLNDPKILKLSAHLTPGDVTQSPNHLESTFWADVIESSHSGSTGDIRHEHNHH